MDSHKRNILEEAGRKDGMKVPEGYFDDFVSRMTAMLPETEFEKESVAAKVLPPPSLWQRVKPYAYMAAMFAGAWCMLKMFSLMSSSDSKTVNFDSDPVIAEAIANPEYIDSYIMGSYSEYDLYEDMVEDGSYEQFLLPDTLTQ